MRTPWYVGLFLCAAACSSSGDTAASRPAGQGSPEPNVREEGMVVREGGVSCHGGQCRFLARPIAPLSTLRVTTHTPTLRWELPEKGKGVTVDLCSDRACDQLLQSLSVTADHVKLEEPLPSGVVFWRLRPLQGPKVVSATWEMFVGPETPADTAFGSTLDVNGDGLADAVVAAGQPAKALVFLGGAGGLSTSPAVTLDFADATYGVRVANGGDIDGDGFADVLVRTGDRLEVFPGGSSGTATAPSSSIAVPPLSSSDLPSEAEVGDFNGDGYGDIVIGDRPNERALVYYGSAEGLTGPGATLRGPVAGAMAAFGDSVDGAGDVNGDGLGDVVVGAAEAVAGEGRAFVFLGGAPDAPAATLIPTGLGTFAFGSNVAGVGDVDGDGLGDVAVGEPSFANPAPASSGRVFVYLDRGGSFGGPPVTLSAPGGVAAAFGSRVEGAGDMDGDGIDELAVSAGYPTIEAGPVGVVFVFRGSASGPVDALWASLLDGSASGRFGDALASPGDIDGDGLSDLLVGAPNSPTSLGGSRPGPGRVYPHRGASSGPQAWPELRAEDYGVRRFGASLD